MTIYALVSENSPVRLWGLSSERRLQRQLREVSRASSSDLSDIRWLKNIDEVPANGRVLLLNGSFLFENRTIKGVLERSDSILQHSDNTAAAAFTDAVHPGDVLTYMRDNKQKRPEGLQVVHTGDMEAFDGNLSRSTKPLLERVSAERKSELESNLYGNAYKGITDLVTKFIWPKPASALYTCVPICTYLQTWLQHWACCWWWLPATCF